MPDSSAPTIVIPPDTLIVHTSNTWSGESCPSHSTRNQSSLSCYTWNFSSDEVARLVDLIHGRSMTGEKWELKQPIRTYCPEADTPIWELIEGTHPSTRITSAFWGGGIDEEIIQALPVPSFARKKCYRELIARIIKEGYTGALSPQVARHTAAARRRHGTRHARRQLTGATPRVCDGVVHPAALLCEVAARH